MSEVAEVSFRHLSGLNSQLDGKPQHCPSTVVEGCLSPVRLQLGQEGVVFEESAQTAPVVGYSVVAVVLEADYQGDQFSFHFAEGCGSRHR